MANQTVPQLDSRLSSIADLTRISKTVNWKLGDEAVDLVRTFSRQVIPEIAAVAGCTRERIRQLIKVSVAFPPEKRLLDVDWAIYRAVLLASKRLGQDPANVLQQVIDQEMSLFDISQMGSKTQDDQ